MDLSQYSATELKNIMKLAEKEMQNRQKEKRQECHNKLKAVCDEYGFTLADFIEGYSESKNTKKAKIKYRDPDNLKNEWSGRGQIPRWVREKQAQGMTLEQFAV